MAKLAGIFLLAFCVLACCAHGTVDQLALPEGDFPTANLSFTQSVKGVRGLPRVGSIAHATRSTNKAAWNGLNWYFVNTNCNTTCTSVGMVSPRVCDRVSGGYLSPYIGNSGLLGTWCNGVAQTSTGYVAFSDPNSGANQFACGCASGAFSFTDGPAGSCRSITPQKQTICRSKLNGAMGWTGNFNGQLVCFFSYQGQGYYTTSYDSLCTSGGALAPSPPPPPPTSGGLSPPPPTSSGFSPPPPASSGFGGGKCPDAQASLDKHNAYRAIHGAAPLRWSEKLASIAQAWSDGCGMQHSGNGYGENLAWHQRTTNQCTYAVEMWYNECPSYTGTFSSASGHFTQVVWKSTTEVGCGYNPCTGKLPYGMITCNYNPPGNYIGQFASNVQALPC